MDPPLNPSRDHCSEEVVEDEPGPGILGEDSMETQRGMDWGTEAPSSTEQPQLGWSDRWQAETKLRQPQQVSLEDPVREQNQLLAVSVDKEVQSTPPPDPGMRRPGYSWVASFDHCEGPYWCCLFSPTQSDGHFWNNMSSSLTHACVSCVLFWPCVLTLDWFVTVNCILWTEPCQDLLFLTSLAESSNQTCSSYVNTFELLGVWKKTFDSLQRVHAHVERNSTITYFTGRKVGKP